MADRGALARSFHLLREQTPDLTRDFQKWPFPLLDTDPTWTLFESENWLKRFQRFNFVLI
jgi:hypothetical protein